MAGKGKPGRKSKLTDALQEQLCAAFKLGATDKIACAAHGISLTAFYRWLQEADGFEGGRKVEFKDAITRAKAAGDLELLEIVRKDARTNDRLGGKQALELLARRHPDAYSAHQTVRHAGHDGGPMPTTSIDLSSLTPEQLAALVKNDTEERAEHGDAYVDSWNDANNTPEAVG